MIDRSDIMKYAYKIDIRIIYECSTYVQWALIQNIDKYWTKLMTVKKNAEQLYNVLQI